MKTLFRLLVCLFLGGSAWAAGETIERFGLLVGSSRGGPGTALLKYAVSDAKRFQEVMVKLGGLPEENALLLLNPGKESLFQGLEFLRSKIRKNKQEGRQAQLLFYFSGHSDEKGLQLGSDRLEWYQLKESLEGSGAGVRIVVLDSCSSGAFTRAKGGRITAPFLFDLSTEVEGHAVLTSSTAEEASQESDRIESSFFTHALIGGLRGAADADSDGQVTLHEAYTYAYGQTTAETQTTVEGTQHPAFDLQLNGQGNLVLTDLRSGGATLRFPSAMGGRITVRDIANKQVAEIAKAPGQELSLGVDEGYYRIRWEDSNNLFDVTVLVNEPKVFPLGPDSFRVVEKSQNARRGDSENRLTWEPVGLRISSPEGTDLFTLNLFGARVSKLDGWMESGFSNWAVEGGSGFQGALAWNEVASGFTGAQVAFGVNLAKADFSGLQATGLVNRADGRFAGAQVGAVNLINDEGRYLQFGVWNQANRFSGVQVGLVNYADEAVGVQVGLINISRRLTGLPIGLIDIQFNGQNHIDQTIALTGGAWDTLDNDWNLATTFRFGSEYFYKYFQFTTRAAYRGTNDTLAAIGLGAGLGLRIPILAPGLALQFDGGTLYSQPDYSIDLRSGASVWRKFVPQGRVFASWSFWNTSGVIAGWEFPVQTEFVHESFTTEGKGVIRTDWGNLYVGHRFFFGVQL